MNDKDLIKAAFAAIPVNAAVPAAKTALTVLGKKIFIFQDALLSICVDICCRL